MVYLSIVGISIIFKEANSISEIHIMALLPTILTDIIIQREAKDSLTPHRTLDLTSSLEVGPVTTMRWETCH